MNGKTKTFTYQTRFSLSEENALSCEYLLEKIEFDANFLGPVIFSNFLSIILIKPSPHRL